MINAYELARKRIVRKKRFYQHFTLFLAIALFLITINILHFVTGWWHYTPGSGYGLLLKDILNYPYWWFPYPVLGWGVLIFIHYCFAFGLPFVGQFDEKWEVEAIEAEMARIQHRAQLLNTAASENPMELKTIQKETLPKSEIKNSELL